MSSVPYTVNNKRMYFSKPSWLPFLNKISWVFLLFMRTPREKGVRHLRITFSCVFPFTFLEQSRRVWPRRSVTPWRMSFASSFAHILMSLSLYFSRTVLKSVAQEKCDTLVKEGVLIRLHIPSPVCPFNRSVFWYSLKECGPGEVWHPVGGGCAYLMTYIIAILSL